MKKILFGKVMARSNSERGARGMNHMLFRKVVVSMLGVVAVTALAGSTVLAGSAVLDIDESASLQLTSAELPGLVAGTLAASDLQRLIVAGPLSDAGTSIADLFGGPPDSDGTVRFSGKRPGDLRKFDEDEDEDRRLEEEEEEQASE